ncbi:MAG TPA: hypothetical protein VH136_18575 [Trebonia sp.]|nr:hypothetical protein [Trebonia sp.]
MSTGRRARAEQVPEAEAALRELLADAHGAIQDLTRLLKEVRAAIAAGAAAADKAAYDAADKQILAFQEHLQREANKASADLNEAVTRARLDVAAAITPTAIHVTEAVGDQPGLVSIDFAGHLFDDAVTVRKT